MTFFHGTLSPFTLYWDGEGWIIDQVWVGQLAGLTSAEQMFARAGVAPGLLAPEMLRWDAAPTLSCDVYGVGAVLHACLTGAAPLRLADAMELVRGAPSPASRCFPVRQRDRTISRRLEEVINKALQPDPVSRYRSLEELERDLSSFTWPADAVKSLLDEAVEVSNQEPRAEWHKAYDAIKTALRLDPGNPLAHHVKAELYFKEDAFEFALEENRKAMKLMRPTPSVFRLQGQCLMALNREVEAEEPLRMALDLEEAVQTRQLLALCLMKQERHKAAARLLREGLGRENHAESRRLLAECLEQSGEPSSALEEYETARNLAEKTENDPAKVQAITLAITNLRSKFGL
jgi:Tfp pilus assembly protein PilF